VLEEVGAAFEMKKIAGHGSPASAKVRRASRARVAPGYCRCTPSKRKCAGFVPRNRHGGPAS
jgi:hypothetical protein